MEDEKEWMISDIIKKEDSCYGVNFTAYVNEETGEVSFYINDELLLQTIRKDDGEQYCDDLFRRFGCLLTMSACYPWTDEKPSRRWRKSWNRLRLNYLWGWLHGRKVMISVYKDGRTEFFVWPLYIQLTFPTVEGAKKEVDRILDTVIRLMEETHRKYLPEFRHFHSYDTNQHRKFLSDILAEIKNSDSILFEKLMNLGGEDEALRYLWAATDLYLLKQEAENIEEPYSKTFISDFFPMLFKHLEAFAEEYKAAKSNHDNLEENKKN